MLGVSQITPTDLKARLDAGEQITILDVREPHEWEIVNLEHIGAFLIPKGQVLERMGELDTAQEMDSGHATALAVLGSLSNAVGAPIRKYIGGYSIPERF